VLPVVGTLAEELLISRDRRQQAHLVLGQRRSRQFGQRAEVYVLYEGSGAGGLARKRRDLAVAEHTPLGAAGVFEAKHV
jgi:hypothetical protein